MTSLPTERILSVRTKTFAVQSVPTRLKEDLKVFERLSVEAARDLGAVFVEIGRAPHAPMNDESLKQKVIGLGIDGDALAPALSSLFFMRSAITSYQDSPQDLADDLRDRDLLTPKGYEAFSAALKVAEDADAFREFLAEDFEPFLPALLHLYTRCLVLTKFADVRRAEKRPREEPDVTELSPVVMVNMDISGPGPTTDVTFLLTEPKLDELIEELIAARGRLSKLRTVVPLGLTLPQMR